MRGIIKDISGSRFGMLVAEHPTTARSSRRVLWLCRCDCGNVSLHSGGDLRSGKVNSCGCQRGKGGGRDITGERFGMLTAISVTDKRAADRKAIWEFLCDCGNRKEMSLGNVVSGKTSSCGCMVRGENSIFYKHGMSGSLEYYRNREFNRRAMKRSTATRRIGKDDLDGVVARSNGKCVYCGDRYEDIDHVVPLSRGGAHVVENLVAACASCNGSKGKKLLGSEWVPPMVREYT